MNQKNYNKVVKDAYNQIISYAQQLISSVTEDPLRGILERQDRPSSTSGYIVHELINPLLYVRLEVYKDDLMGIHYGYEQSDLYSRFYPITSAFIRSIYRCTAKENTSIDIEDCVRTDWVITNCSEMYEYISETNKVHQCKWLEYHLTFTENGIVLNMPDCIEVI